MSVCYVALQRVLQLLVLRFRSNDLKDLEIVVSCRRRDRLGGLLHDYERAA